MRNKQLSKRFAFAKEITIVVCVKVAVLAAIWAVFFSDPVNAKIDDAKMVSHLFATSLQRV